MPVALFDAYGNKRMCRAVLFDMDDLASGVAREYFKQVWCILEVLVFWGKYTQVRSYFGS